MAPCRPPRDSQPICLLPSMSPGHVQTQHQPPLGKPRQHPSCPFRQIFRPNQPTRHRTPPIPIPPEGPHRHRRNHIIRVCTEDDPSARGTGSRTVRGARPRGFGGTIVRGAFEGSGALVCLVVAGRPGADVAGVVDGVENVYACGAGEGAV